MKKYIIQIGLIAGLLAIVAGVGAAQELPGNGTTLSDVQEVSVDLFEDPTLWRSHISRDDGIAVHQRFLGGPNGKDELPIAQTISGRIEDENVLGIKTEFIRRGFTEIVFTPARPISVPGIVQELSIWVAGRELEHELHVLISNIDGDLRKLYVGQLNFRGWRKLSVTVPPYSRNGGGVLTGVKQFDPRRPLDSGIDIEAIIIEPLYTEAYGTYYVYFDDLRATTDLAVITERDTDDPVDAW